MRMGVEVQDTSFAAVAGQENVSGRSPAPISSRLASLLGSKDRDYLLSRDGTQVKMSDLEGKVVALYFSANWYPPSRNFNQFLIGAYQQLKSTNGSNFEIVFVSCDEDLNAFNGSQSRKDVEQNALRNGVELLHRFGVNAFPFTKQKLEQLEKEDKEKHDSQTLVNLLTNRDRDYVLSHHGARQVPVASLVGKTIGLYFSAQWCLPCEKFTPKLVPIYHKIKADDEDDFEIVFVSSDRDHESYASYFSLMPWLAIPFGDANIRSLAKHFDVQGIPCLVILGPDGRTVTAKGRSLINLYQENAFPFTESKVELLESQVDEEARDLPRTKLHGGHRHELNLVSQENGGGPFICCNCEEQGVGWAYQCLDCGYELHPKCVRVVGDHAVRDVASNG
ncbi:unnamed protein product [Linum trigynum]|uniref:protein-disulfide reductase n=1 Tax=Linum trigynum TaxID=586398 RepID=A0AAV2CG21_9ROSI